MNNCNWCVSLDFSHILALINVCLVSVKTDTAFYHSVPVRNALDYRSVTLLEVTVPLQAALVSWNFNGVALSDAPCRDRDIIM